MKKSYFIFLILCLGMLVLGIVFAGANILAFINFPAFVVIVFLPAFVVMGVFGLSAFLRSFRVAFRGVAASIEELRTSTALFKMLGPAILVTGFTTTMIGLITMLVDLKDKDEIGLAVAISVITLFYSINFYLLVALPFKTACEKRLVEARAGEAF